jgi:Na+-translocating ferredoxin:NAD+ oxidoreductase RnfD subunit
MIHFRSIKVQINLFLIAFAVFLYLKEPHPAFLTGFFWAVFFSVLIEGILLFFKTRKFQITGSALTSGLIIGYVLSSGSPWWTFLAVAACAVGLKRVLLFHGKNLMNPAALGLFLAVLPFSGTTEWKGAYEWYLLVPAGLYFAYKIRKTEIVLGYFAMSLVFFVPQALEQGTPLINIAGYFNYFFIFIMLIEPKTAPATRWPKIVFGAEVACLVFLLTELGFPYEPELFALLIMNAFVPLLNEIPNLKFSTSKEITQKELL